MTGSTAHGEAPIPLALDTDASGQLGIDLRRVPSDDAGATTPASFHYQTEITASICACMPTDPSIVAVICEWHEDFIIVRAGSDAQYELVSVKHHEREHYTSLGRLCGAGGLAHLFDRWLGFTATTRARLCSNAKLAGKPSEASPRALEQLCNSGQLATASASGIISHLAWAIMDVIKDIAPDDDRFENIPRPVTRPLPTKKHRDSPAGLPDGVFDALVRFLMSLRFDCGRPDKPHIMDTNVRQLVEPAMNTLGLRPAAAPAAYAAIVGLISEASRDHSGRPRDLARYLAYPDADKADVKVLETLKRRTVSREQILSAMRTGAQHAAGNVVALLRSASPLPRAAGGHQLRGKMTTAGIGEDEQNNALELRDLWLHMWPQVRTGFPEDAEHQFRLQLEILDIVRDVHRQLLAVPDPFGVQFQAELHKALRSARLQERSGVALDEFHIIGFAYELSDRCKFGFVRRGGEQ